MKRDLHAKAALTLMVVVLALPVLSTSATGTSQPEISPRLAQDCSAGKRAACSGLEAALRRLESEGALNTADKEVPACRELAKIAAKLNHFQLDQTLLAELIEGLVECGSVRTRVATISAISRLTDQSVLAEVAERLAALQRWNALGDAIDVVSRLTDQSLLAKVALDSGKSELRRAAVERLAGEVPLQTVAAQARDATVRAIAQQKLDYLRTARSDHDAVKRRVAVTKITDQSALARIAVEDADLFVQREAAATLVKTIVNKAIMVRAGCEVHHGQPRRSAQSLAWYLPDNAVVDESGALESLELYASAYTAPRLDLPLTVFLLDSDDRPISGVRYSISRQPAMI